MTDDILVPPHDADAERGLIGSLLFMPAAIDEITSMVTIADFYLLSHQRIYRAIESLHRRNVPAIDAVIVADELNKMQALTDVGGVQYLMEVLQSVPHASHARYYASIVRQHSQRRAIINIAREAIKVSYSGTQDVTDVANKAAAALEELLGSGSGDIRTLSDVVASLRTRQANPLPPQSTGIKDVDDKLKPFGAPSGGLRPTQLIVVGARPGMGKTAYVMGLIEAAAEANTKGLFVALEMHGEDLAERIDRADRSRLDTLVQQGNVFIEDQQFELDAIVSTIRQAHRRKGIRFVVLDYLGLIEVNGVLKEGDKISRITRRMKLLANELRIPIVLAAQLNRDLEKRDNKRPQLSDIRGSGTIEQDADVVIFLYRHEVYHQGEKEGQAEVIVAKQRNGPTGIIEVGYLKEQTRFIPKQQIPVNVDGFFEDKQAPF